MTEARPKNLAEMRLKMESRLAAVQREQEEADGRNELWTAFGAIRMTGGDRIGFFLLKLGNHQHDTETRDAFDSQYRDSGILFGPCLVIGNRTGALAEVSKLFVLDEIRARFVQSK